MNKNDIGNLLEKIISSSKVAWSYWDVNSFSWGRFNITC